MERRLWVWIALVVALCWLGPQEAWAQGADWLREQNQSRMSFNQGGMLVLGGWAVANMAVGGAGWALADDERWRFFHQMNLMWNVINLGLALGGYLGGLGDDPGSYDLAQTIKEGAFLQKIYLFNAGLDVGYMMGGAFLWERGLRKDQTRLVGYGQSVILQGAFLMIFDLVMFFGHADIQEAIYPVLGKDGVMGVGMLW